MALQKIKSGRIPTVQASTYVGEKGTIFYDENVGELRLSDGSTPGGIPITTAGTGTFISTSTSLSSDIDGGEPTSVYGGVTSIDAGGV